MKRDMDLIREILLKLEAHDSAQKCLQTNDRNNAYQAALMKEAGLVDVVIITDAKGLPSAAVFLRLTWAGHDFLDAARDATLWKKAVEKVIKPGMSWSFSLLIEWLKQEAKRRLLGDQAGEGTPDK